MAQEFRRFMRLEIADGRARKEADPRQRRDRGRNFKCAREVGDDGMHGQAREIAPQLRRLALQKVAGNVDGHIGLDRRRGAKQDARLAARTGAEFDQGAIERKQRGDRRRMLTQQRDLAARRIIFRQLRDALEQSGAGEIVEIFRRQPLSASRSVLRGHRQRRSLRFRRSAPRGARFARKGPLFSSSGGSQC